MSTPRLTPALAALRDGFDELSPGRDRTSDGWIGDAAHQAGVSGHNPDDTAGSRPEYTDADSTPEVRAIDVDADLRHPSVTMDDAIARILATPADRARLSYVIFRRRIASAKYGWVWRPYDGPNPHDKHAHFSGTPGTDNDGRPWSVATMGGGDMSEQAEREIHSVFAGMFNGGSSMGRAVDPDGTGARPAANSIVAKLDYLLGRVDQVAAALDQVDERVVAGVLSGLPADRIAAALAAALPPELAEQVVDELAARIGSTNAG